MNCPWLVRAVALLLVLVGLQAGSFQDLDAGHERFYGTDDYTSAVRPEVRKSELDSVEPQPAQDRPERQAAMYRVIEIPSASATPVALLPQRFRPAPTGPPRA
ncbi:MAG TPA: hypothetical protein VFS80_17745 [Burkholderiales bacterium]|nr:hypothetical protein [Burkholderiales bacterium]